MKNIGWISRFLMQPSAAPARAKARQATGVLAAALLLVAAGYASAQDAAAALAPPSGAQMSIPQGYAAHYSIDMGGRMTNQYGSGSMYDTLVNYQSGPRVLGESFEMHALPSNKHTLVDNLSAFGSGLGGDPYNFAKMDISKGNIYEFSANFRRDRRYFDYDLLGNPGIPTGYSIPISGSSTPYAWPQVNQSPFLFNTVRRMTNTNLTLFPLSKVTFRFGYSQNIFQGPSLTPSGNSVAGQEVILQEYQRNSTDDFMGAIDWKPVRDTKLTFEEQIDHYKGDSYFTMAPQYLNVQESDGTKVALLSSYQSFVPYGYTATGAYSPSSVCNSAVGASILYANPNGGLPIIDPACNVITSYFRSQPTREIFPTEIFRLQSTSIKNIAMNGDVRYTKANMNLPNYYDDFQGLSKTTRELAYTAFANAKRDVIAVDYGIVWQASSKISLSDQLTYSNVHQPGTAEFTSGTTVSIASGAGTIYNTGLTSKTVSTGSGPFGHSGPAIGTPQFNYFGQKFAINNATVTWDATARSTFSLTYRYSSHTIAEGSPNNTSSQTGEELYTIDENGAIFTAAVHPTNQWDINGSIEALYDNNVLTPVMPRQTRIYRVHTIYRPKTWATISGVYNDQEHHDNTNNTGTPSPVGPLEHVDYNRFFDVSAALYPNEHYGLDLTYGYNAVYAATNICFQGAATAMPGGTVAPAAATPSGNLCGKVAAGYGAQTVLFGPAKDFEDAPTQFGSVALALSPVDRIHSNVGYRINAVNGSRFFTDAGDVNGTVVNTYQTPFVNVAWTVHKGFIWRAEYDYFGYGEGGRSGAQYCNANPNLTVGTAGPLPVVPCSSVPNTAMSSTTPVYGFTAPRNFHANNVLLGFHYEF